MIWGKVIRLFIMSLVGLISLTACNSPELISYPSVKPSSPGRITTLTLTPNSTQTSIPTLAPSPIPVSLTGQTPTSQPTPTIQVSLPKIQGDISNYRLTHPSPETLIKLQLSRTAQMVYSDAPLEDLLYPGFNNLLDFEWQRVYTYTRYSDELFALIPNFYDHAHGRLTNQMLMDLVGDHVIQVLNNQKIELIDGGTYEIPNFSGESYQVEIDGDENSEWLVKISNWDGFYLGEYHFWITLDQAKAGQYTRLLNEIPWQSGWSDINPDENLQDIDGDGIKDAAIIENRFGSGQSLVVSHIAIGKSDGFHVIPSTVWEYTEDSLGRFVVQYEWTKSLDNDLPILKIIINRKLLPWDCEFTEIKEYQWVNGAESIKIQPLALPGTAVCSIARAMDSQDTPDRETQIRLLNNVFNHPDGLSDEYRVFVLYRLALLHSLEGDDSASRESIELISEIANTRSTPFAESIMTQIQPILAEGQVYPYKLCLAAENIAKEIPEEAWSPITGVFSYPYEGYFNGFPSPLCDTREIQMEVLNKLNFHLDVSPEATLKNAGIPARIVQPIENNESTIGWLILIDDTNPDYPSDPAGAGTFSTNDYTYVMWKIENQDWDIITTLDYIENSNSIFINSSDLTGDGIPEISIAYPYPNLLETDCIEGEIPYSLRTMTAIKDDWLVDYFETICQPSNSSLDFATIFQDINGDGITDRTMEYFQEKEFEAGLIDLDLLSEIPNENPWMVSRSPYWEIMQYINKAYMIEDINARFLASSNPADLQSEIVFYRDRWGTDDEIGRNIRAHLNYLLGLSYESTGEDEKATESFFNIWHDQPDTIWAYLAASRLE